MDEIEKTHLAGLTARLRDVAYQLTRVQFVTAPIPHHWSPAIDAYRCAAGFVICVDLAGVDASVVELVVEPSRVVIRGQRSPPEPAEEDGSIVHVLALEIDHGPFEREVLLPEETDAGSLRAEHHNGLLWIHLPVRRPT